MSKTLISSLFVASLIFLFACRKTSTGLDLQAPSSEAQSKTLPHFKKCQLEKVAFAFEDGWSKRSVVFSYNNQGDPVSIIQLPYTTTGFPNYFFVYDNKHRLTEMFRMYGNGKVGEGGGESYNKYFYASPGSKEIIMDSAYYYPYFQNGILINYFGGAQATWYLYDDKGRVIRDSAVTDNNSQHTRVTNYTYDANGNRTGRIYDNKVNLHRTHEIWMFLDRDYSLNNPFTAQTYNAQQLPTDVDLTGVPGQGLSFLILYLKRASLSYDCK